MNAKQDTKPTRNAHTKNLVNSGGEGDTKERREKATGTRKRHAQEAKRKREDGEISMRDVELAYRARKNRLAAKGRTTATTRIKIKGSGQTVSAINKFIRNITSDCCEKMHLLKIVGGDKRFFLVNNVISAIGQVESKPQLPAMYSVVRKPTASQGSVV
jgi:hypothetical protein